MKVNSITIDSSNSITDLCKLGVIYPTDKSPYNIDDGLHKHAYTAIYDLIFSHMRYDNITIGEIGIYLNNSMKCWRDYFPNGTLYGYEWDDNYILKAKDDNLRDTHYIKMNVGDKSSIEEGMKNIEFDILIDDSTHNFNDQINVINIAYNYLKPGGILIIEDIFISEDEKKYAEAIKSVEKYFQPITFVFANHTLQYSPGWVNDKLLILYRNNTFTEHNYISHIEKSLNNANNNISKISKEIIDIEGMTGLNTKHLYNNLLNIPDARYLEIGTWKGSSLCSAIYKNKAKVVCIDDWSEFGGAKDEFLYNLEKYKGDNTVSYIEEDCFSIDISTIGSFNIYLYDGNHSEESHYKSLTYYYNCLDDVFIFIVDDWNWERVREGTEKAIEDLHLSVLYKKEIQLSEDTTKDPLWWNGIAVFLFKKSSI